LRAPDPDTSRTDIQVAVLRRYSRAVLALRDAFQRKRFGLVLGAGVNKGFAFRVPDWKELLDRISAHPSIEGASVDRVDAAATTRAEILYRHFLRKRRAEIQAHPESAQLYPRADMMERQVKGEWYGVIRSILYEHAPTDGLEGSHPFLGRLVELVVQSPVTITYNFDSYLEDVLVAREYQGDERGRTYETVFEPNTAFRSRTGVILHPNGYLPRKPLERASDTLVFSEEEFGDQLIDSVAGRYGWLAHHFSKTSCLLLGLSLNDDTLRHLLRRNARDNPGHFHYYIQYRSADRQPSDDYDLAVFNYRLDLYHLYTLLLDAEEIAALSDLIRADFHEFRDLAARAGVPTKYVFYLTGIPGVGKTTTLRTLGSLLVYDEWMTDPDPRLAQPFTSLSPTDAEEVDRWVRAQFRAKNEALRREREGLFVVERGPLDPLAFATKTDRARHAQRYHNEVVPLNNQPLQAGSIIMLLGDPREVAARLASRAPYAQDPEYLGELQSHMKEIYSFPGVEQIDVAGWSRAEVSEAVARRILTEEYVAADCQYALMRIERGDPPQ
jgi:hypothetical protein